MKYSFSPHQYLLSMFQVVLTRTVLGSVSTGRYGGNSNNGSPQNPDSPPGQPMSDDHRDHLDDHDHEGFTAYKDLNKKLSRSDQISVPGIYAWISTQSENRNLKTAAKWRNPEHKSKKSRPQNKVVNSFEIFRKTNAISSQHHLMWSVTTLYSDSNSSLCITLRSHLYYHLHASDKSFKDYLREVKNCQNLCLCWWKPKSPPSVWTQQWLSSPPQSCFWQMWNLVWECLSIFFVAELF